MLDQELHKRLLVEVRCAFVDNFRFQHLGRLQGIQLAEARFFCELLNRFKYLFKILTGKDVAQVFLLVFRFRRSSGKAKLLELAFDVVELRLPPFQALLLLFSLLLPSLGSQFILLLHDTQRFDGFLLGGSLTAFFTFDFNFVLPNRLDFVSLQNLGDRIGPSPISILPVLVRCRLVGDLAHIQIAFCILMQQSEAGDQVRVR